MSEQMPMFESDLVQAPCTPTRTHTRSYTTRIPLHMYVKRYGCCWCHMCSLEAGGGAHAR